ncbi:hypothetical protein TSOC_005931, partial [Tetrabaena socialis]
VCLSIAVELLPCEVGTELEMPSQADPSAWTTCSTCRRDQLGLWIDQRRPVAAINTSNYSNYMQATSMQLLSNNGSEETSRSTAAAINLDIIFTDNRSLALGLCQQLWHSYSPMQQLLVATRHNVSATTFNSFNLPPCAMLAASTPASLAATSYMQMQCTTGYTGNLCATCKPGYSLNSDYQCTPCPAMARTVVVGLLAFIGTVVFTLYTCSSNLGQQHADAMEAHAVSSLDVLKRLGA